MNLKPGGSPKGFNLNSPRVQPGVANQTVVYPTPEGLNSEYHHVHLHPSKNQQEHQESFLDEYRRLLKEAGIEFDEKYLE